MHRPRFVALTCFALTALLLPGLVLALEFDVPELVGTYGCANTAVDVELTGVDGIPEQVVLRLEGQHTSGIHLACTSPSFPAGAWFYSFVEIVAGLRSEAGGSLAVETIAFAVELEFENHLWCFDSATVPLELWFCIHPDYAPVICDSWWECPVTEITAATLIVEPTVATNSSTWTDIKAIFE